MEHSFLDIYARIPSSVSFEFLYFCFVGGNNLSPGSYITTEDMSDFESNSNKRAYKRHATL